MSPAPRPLRLAAHAAGVLALNMLIFGVYRALFVAWFGPPGSRAASAVIARGLRLDAAALAAELLAVGAVLLITRRARGAVLAGALWTLTTLNLLVAGIDLLFYHERNQHLWEMLFANLAELHDIWVALEPFLLQNPGTVALLLGGVAAIAVTAVTHARRLRGHRHDLWRPWPVPVAAVAGLALIGLLMGHWTTVKRVFPHASVEFVWISSRHQMVFNDYVLNQAVVNPVWDLVHEYLPAALTGNVGYKPTIGRWSTQGIVPLSPNFDTPGFLARSMDDALLAAVHFDRHLFGDRAGAIGRAAGKERYTIGVPAGLPSSGFVAVDIAADADAHPTWKQPVRAYFRNDGGSWKLVGLDRMGDKPTATAGQKAN